MVSPTAFYMPKDGHPINCHLAACSSEMRPFKDSTVSSSFGRKVYVGSKPGGVPGSKPVVMFQL